MQVRRERLYTVCARVTRGHSRIEIGFIYVFSVKRFKFMALRWTQPPISYITLSPKKEKERGSPTAPRRAPVPPGCGRAAVPGDRLSGVARPCRPCRLCACYLYRRLGQLLVENNLVCWLCVRQSLCVRHVEKETQPSSQPRTIDAPRARLSGSSPASNGPLTCSSPGPEATCTHPGAAAPGTRA